MRIPVQIDRIDRAEALRYLGVKGHCVDDNIERQLDRAQDMVLSAITPMVIAQHFSLAEDLAFQGSNFSAQGKDIKRLLASCSEAYLLAATLGAQSERLLLRVQALSAADALVLDAVMTAMIEQVCDAACEMIVREEKARGRYLTQRFSPGYGDLPLAQTAQILGVLDAPRQIGLTVSSSGLMIPRKSVTAIIGAGEKKTQDAALSGCAACRMANQCNMKKNGAKGCAVMGE